MSNFMLNDRPQISIGLPVYNGEKFIRNALRSLLEQSFINFELIISDNGSTDTTELICRSFAEKDKRIKYFRQNHNMEILWNFNFVLQRANGEYFMWAGMDDVWHPEFIQKNLAPLEQNTGFVGSISEVEFYYELWTEKDFGRFKNTVPKKKYQLVHPIQGNYEDKVRFVFDFNKPQCVYGIYRTGHLKKSMIKRRFGSCDYAIILNVMKYGNLNVVDELLMYMYRGHKNTDNNTKLFSALRRQNYSILHSLFPFVPLTLWCVKNLGLVIFLGNLRRFIKMNYRAERLVFFELFAKKKARSSSDV